MQDPKIPVLRDLRRAGLCYVIIILCGVSAELALRGPLLAGGDPALTWARALAAPAMLRGAILLDIVMLLADIALALLLYRILRPWGAELARLAMVLRLMQAAIIAASLLFLAEAVVLLDGPGTAGPETLARLLAAHGLGYDLGLVFFAANTVLTALLLRRADLIGPVLGSLLQGAAVVYLGGSVVRLMAPQLSAAIEPAYLLPLVAESGLALSLLVACRVTRSGRQTA